MEKSSALLKADPDVLRLFGRGVKGYIRSETSPCYIVLSDDTIIKVSIWEHQVMFKFECFALELSVSNAKPESELQSFATTSGKTLLSALLREEYVEEAREDVASKTVGHNALTQSAAKPGNIPASAIASCVVAYGLLIEGGNNRLLIAADWFPYNMVVTTDEEKILQYLKKSEVVAID